MIDIHTAPNAPKLLHSVSDATSSWLLTPIVIVKRLTEAFFFFFFFPFGLSFWGFIFLDFCMHAIFFGKNTHKHARGQIWVSRSLSILRGASGVPMSIESDPQFDPGSMGKKIKKSLPKSAI